MLESLSDLAVLNCFHDVGHNGSRALQDASDVAADRSLDDGERSSHAVHNVLDAGSGGAYALVRELLHVGAVKLGRVRGSEHAKENDCKDSGLHFSRYFFYYYFQIIVLLVIQRAAINFRR